MTFKYKEEELAIEIVKNGITDDIKKNFKDCENTQEAKEFSEAFWTFSNEEYKQFESLQKLIENYLKITKPERPLCLAVFGQPGSGKSFTIKEILKKILGDNIDPSVINLTQIRNEDELAVSLKKIITKEKSVPIITFDEFDTIKQSAPWGWLSWFLAPMQDAKYQLNGECEKIPKAVFVFTGGTASNFKDFSENNTSAFNKAKGPDFASRLHGFCDIKGPNNEPRMIRRAILLHDFLKKRAKARNIIEEINDELIKSLLGVGRYRHGARSIEAIIESLAIKPDNAKNPSKLTLNDLPDEHILAIHRDLGPLDPKRINGTIQFIGAARKEEQSKYEKIWITQANRLWHYGARLVYGGEWYPDKDNFTKKLVNQVKLLPRLLQKEDDKSTVYLRLTPPLEWGGEKVKEDSANYLLLKKEDGSTEECQYCKMNKVDGLTKEYLDAYNKIAANLRLSDNYERCLKSSINLFWMRLQVVKNSVATVVIGGQSDPFDRIEKRRFIGIAEEVVLALKYKHPIYLCGGPGGTVTELGKILGIIPYSSTPEIFIWPKNYEWKNFKDAIQNFKDFFRPPGLEDLPLTDTDLINFLKKYSIHGDLWPKNGLTIEENHSLFQETDAEKIAVLIKKGLYKRFRIPGA